MDQFLIRNKRYSTETESMSSASGMIMKKRKYRKCNDGYSEFSFTSTAINGEDRTLLVTRLDVILIIGLIFSWGI